MAQAQPDDFDPSHNDQTVRTRRLSEAESRVEHIDAREEKRWKLVQVIAGFVIAAVGVALATPRYIRAESNEEQHTQQLGELTARMKAIETKVDMLIMFEKATPIHLERELTPPPATIKEAR